MKPGDDPLNIPYRDIPIGAAGLGDVQLAGGLIVMAAAVDVPGHGPTPGLAFRFRDEHGDIGKPILLILEDPELVGVENLVHQCIHRALQVVAQQRARNN